MRSSGANSIGRLAAAAGLIVITGLACPKTAWEIRCTLKADGTDECVLYKGSESESIQLPFSLSEPSNRYAGDHSRNAEQRNVHGLW